MRTMLRRIAYAAILGGAAATLVNLAGVGWDHSQPLTTGCASKRADLADSCTEGDARLLFDPAASLDVSLVDDVRFAPEQLGSHGLAVGADQWAYWSSGDDVALGA